MLRAATALLAASPVIVALAGSCAPPTPKPLDTSSYPSASTSAAPLFISNMPAQSASAAQPAGSASAPAH